MKRSSFFHALAWLLVIAIPAAYISLNARDVQWFIGRYVMAYDESTHRKDGFSGIFNSDGKVENLFPLEETGASTESIQQAAEAFIATLSPEQVQAVVYDDIESEEWRSWSNVDNGLVWRDGLYIKYMTQEQQDAAYGLLQSSLSLKGYELSRNIMRTEHTLWELYPERWFLDEELFAFTIFGNPSATDPWGWQLEGHHLVINYFVLGDQVVMTPTFLGGEPILSAKNRYEGNILFQEEQDAGLAFMRSLPADMQVTATINPLNTKTNNLTEAYSDNVTIDYEGIQASRMDAEQKQALLDLAAIWIGNIRDAHAAIKMDEIRSHIDNTWFAWIGETETDSVFYYRIHSPVIYIEFDHQAVITLEDTTGLPTRDHIHASIRTPNGNDYGRELLRQHLADHH